MSNRIGDTTLERFQQYNYHKLQEQKQQESDLDHLRMPPPKHFSRQGTKQLQEAVRNKNVLLSLPHQEAIRWMNFESGALKPQNSEPQVLPLNSTTPNRHPHQQRNMNSPDITARRLDSEFDRTIPRKKKSRDPLHPSGGKPTDNYQAHLQGKRNLSRHQNNYFPSEDANLSLRFEQRAIHQEDQENQYQGYEHGTIEANDGFQGINSADGNATDNQNIHHNGHNFPIVQTTLELIHPLSGAGREEPGQEPSEISPSFFAHSERKRKSCGSSCSTTNDGTLNSCADEGGQGGVEIPTSTFKDVIGHQAVKMRLQEILLPLKLSPELCSTIFRGIRSLPASVLFHGPPGTGKTLLAQAMAGEAKAAFVSVGPSDILSKYVGESEAAVRSIFSGARRKARDSQSKCAVVFFDEIDALGQSRASTNDSGATPGAQLETGGTDGCSRRVLAELLIQLTKLNFRNGKCKSTTNVKDLTADQASTMCHEDEDDFYPSSCDHDDGVDREIDGQLHSDVEAVMKDSVCVIVLAATNRIQDCDPALLRRFGVQVPVGLPTQKDRLAMIKLHLKDIEHTLSVKDINRAAKATEGWSGSDMENLCRDCAMAPVRECIREVVLAERRLLRDSNINVNNGYDNELRALSEVDLEGKFSSIRPVSFDDFIAAMRSWAIRASDGSSSNQLSQEPSVLSVHYDSSSDEEYD
ncbi:ATPase family associated with various cellular activities AAA [Nitzschia inconspicua]|uniref:ATPase family associated with various cellular activities AAA n=1 Tax=Nitzschia inconspicua TaxID=303405 RepID=A0A9K3LJB9_9STRA|nr:ATPase family associated with various cellular activities AAA [Nitzschia inconspicua]KAG7363484.1 ATPase family associated with various cellular activities AAA [Nitzschia inconspicua]